MEIITYSEARSNFKSTIDKVCEDRAPVFITRKNGEPVVMMSLEDYNAWEETLYLMKSTTNKKRLLGAVERMNNSDYQSHTLIEE